MRLPVAVTVDGQGSPPPEVRLALYRIAQEALNNAAKHAEASLSTLAARWTADSARLIISDDGRGFDPATVSHAHLGLGIMRERADGISAVLSVKSAVGRGTTIEVNWSAGPAAKP